MESYNDKMKDSLRNLREKILEEYDNSEEIGVRINLLPKTHNTMDEYEICYKDGDELPIVENWWNAHHDPANVVIHETSPGMTAAMPDGIETEEVERPTKPHYSSVDELYAEGVTDEMRHNMYIKNRGTEHYDKLIRNYGYNKGHGRTIGYHARIDFPKDKYKGMIGKPEIVILMPATASPDQVSNKNVTQYIYGIERCVGEEQDYHLAIANQAMLTAFVLKEIGYDKDTAMKHIFPHNFFNKGACPARMLYASYLVDKIQKGKLEEKDYDQALEDINEYVPWEVFMGLVKSFVERDRYPEELQKKFIYDMSDYDAYVNDPENYDYRLRKAQKPQRFKKTINIDGKEEMYTKPSDIHFSKIDISDVKINSLEDDELEDR